MEYISKKGLFWSSQRGLKWQNTKMPGFLDHSGQLCRNHYATKSAGKPEMGGRTWHRIVKFQWKGAVLIAEVIMVMQVNNVSNIQNTEFEFIFLLQKKWINILFIQTWKWLVDQMFSGLKNTGWRQSINVWLNSQHRALISTKTVRRYFHNSWYNTDIPHSISEFKAQQFLVDQIEAYRLQTFLCAANWEDTWRRQFAFLKIKRGKNTYTDIVRGNSRTEELRKSNLN